MDALYVIVENIDAKMVEYRVRGYEEDFEAKNFDDGTEVDSAKGLKAEEVNEEMSKESEKVEAEEHVEELQGLRAVAEGTVRTRDFEGFEVAMVTIESCHSTDKNKTARVHTATEDESDESKDKNKELDKSETPKERHK